MGNVEYLDFSHLQSVEVEMKMENVTWNEVKFYDFYLYKM